MWRWGTKTAQLKRTERYGIRDSDLIQSITIRTFLFFFITRQTYRHTASSLISLSFFFLLSQSVRVFAAIKMDEWPPCCLFSLDFGASPEEYIHPSSLFSSSLRSLWHSPPSLPPSNYLRVRARVLSCPPPSPLPSSLALSVPPLSFVLTHPLSPLFVCFVSLLAYLFVFVCVCACLCLCPFRSLQMNRTRIGWDEWIYRQTSRSKAGERHAIFFTSLSSLPAFPCSPPLSIQFYRSLFVMLACMCTFLLFFWQPFPHTPLPVTLLSLFFF